MTIQTRNKLPSTLSPTRTLSRDYAEAFSRWISVGSCNASAVTAAMYEGSGPSGGFAVPSIVNGSIVQLATQDSAIRRLATVIPTSDNVRFPTQATRGAAAAKAESGATSNLFLESDSTYGTFTLGAYQAGVVKTVSSEFAQDVIGISTFITQDGMLDLETYEEGKFLTGSGIEEPQGLLGNTGAGVTAATADGAGNLLSIAATYDVLDTLKGKYHRNASWLMSRPTGTALRKAQDSSDLVFSREGGQDYLHGYPVEYSASMPAIAPGATPVLFGDFAFGYIIGDRGGPGVNVHMLDQPRALEGLVDFLIYRRTDGRVRRSEAIQAITLHS